jgi:hypothetical protein
MIQPKVIMASPVAVEAHAHPEVVDPEELSPLVIDECGIGLNGVSHYLARLQMGGLELQHPLEERQPGQEGLATEPYEEQLSTEELHVLAKELLQQMISHPMDR